MKRFISILLVAAMAVMLFSSCGKTDEPKEENNVNVSVVLNMGDTVTLMPTEQEMDEKTEDETDSIVYEFESDDNTVIEVDESGLVKAVGEGEATVTVRYGESSNTCSFVVKQLGTVGVEDTETVAEGTSVTENKTTTGTANKTASTKTSTPNNNTAPVTQQAGNNSPAANAGTSANTNTNTNTGNGADAGNGSTGTNTTNPPADTTGSGSAGTTTAPADPNPSQGSNTGTGGATGPTGATGFDNTQPGNAYSDNDTIDLPNTWNDGTSIPGDNTGAVIDEP